MKGFIFSDSFHELKKTTTLTVSGALIALAIILRAVAIQITPEIRITFAFIPIMAIAMLYGPFVAVIANVSTDFLGFLIDTKSSRGYNPFLMIVVIIAAVIYGCFLYRKNINMGIRLVMIGLARLTVVLVCNIGLNSYVLYKSYYNKDFSVFNIDNAFWTWFGARVIKNVFQLPVDIVLLLIILPAVAVSYKRVFRKNIRSF